MLGVYNCKFQATVFVYELILYTVWRPRFGAEDIKWDASLASAAQMLAAVWFVKSAQYSLHQLNAFFSTRNSSDYSAGNLYYNGTDFGAAVCSAD